MSSAVACGGGGGTGDPRRCDVEGSRGEACSPTVGSTGLLVCRNGAFVCEPTGGAGGTSGNGGADAGVPPDAPPLVMMDAADAPVVPEDRPAMGNDVMPDHMTVSDAGEADRPPAGGTPDTGAGTMPDTAPPFMCTTDYRFCGETLGATDGCCGLYQTSAIPPAQSTFVKGPGARIFLYDGSWFFPATAEVLNSWQSACADRVTASCPDVCAAVVQHDPNRIPDQDISIKQMPFRPGTFVLESNGRMYVSGRNRRLHQVDATIAEAIFPGTSVSRRRPMSAAQFASYRVEMPLEMVHVGGFYNAQNECARASFDTEFMGLAQ